MEGDGKGSYWCRYLSYPLMLFVVFAGRNVSQQKERNPGKYINRLETCFYIVNSV